VLRFASWSAFIPASFTASETTGPTDIRNACLRRVQQVNDAMPTIVFEAKDPRGNERTAVAVTMDGEPLVSQLEGTAMSLDPGEHVYTFQAADQPPVEKRLVIHEEEKERYEVIGIRSTNRVPEFPRGVAYDSSSWSEGRGRSGRRACASGARAA
jgi:hypothetical protein